MTFQATILTLYPEMFPGPLGASIAGRAKDEGKWALETVQIRDFATDKHRTVDDSPYGGGAGMVMMCEPLAKAIEELSKQRTYEQIIFLTPDGKRFDQPMANRLSLGGDLLMICGHYKGIDQRIRDQYVTLEISIGDFVLSGGEIPAALIVDAIGRLIPGVLNDETSALTDSFQDNLLAPPVYTRPDDFRGWKVPDVLMSGNHRLIEEWRHEQSLQRTQERRPDLLDS